MQAAKHWIFHVWNYNELIWCSVSTVALRSTKCLNGWFQNDRFFCFTAHSKYILSHSSCGHSAASHLFARSASLRMSQPRASSEDSHRRYPVPAWHFERPVCRQSWLWIARFWQQAAFTNGSGKAEREVGGRWGGVETQREGLPLSTETVTWQSKAMMPKLGSVWCFSCAYMHSFSALINLFVYADPLFHCSFHHQCSKKMFFDLLTLLFFLPFFFFCSNCESGCSLEYMLTGACSPRNPLLSFLSCPFLSSPPIFQSITRQTSNSLYSVFIVMHGPKPPPTPFALFPCT